MRFLCIFLLLLCAPVWAAPKEELSKVEAGIKEQEALTREYERQQQNIRKKLDQVRDELIRTTREVQLRERALLKVQTKRDKTRSDMEQAQERLDKERQSLAQLVLALQRLDRMPPQALLARPSAPIDTARSFYLLQNVMPVLSARTKNVKATLDEMAELGEVLDKQEKNLQAEQKELQSGQEKLEASLGERKTLLKDTEKSRQEAEKKAANLAKQAKDLRDLMTRLSKIEKKQPPAKKAVAALGQSLPTWLGGKAPLPVEGRIMTGYGQGLSGGGKSEGVSIAAAPGAIVTAPGDGIVRFAGPFRQYKLLVIIQHKNGDHSLLGGMQEVYTETGEKVASGEPVGKLPVLKMTGDSSQQASLYYERRHNGKPIDPRNARG